MSELEIFLDGPITVSRIAEAVKKFGEGAVNEFLVKLTSHSEIKLPDFSKMTDEQTHDWLFKHELSAEDLKRVPSEVFAASLRFSADYYNKHIKGTPPETEQELVDRMRLGEEFPDDVFRH